MSYINKDATLAAIAQKAKDELADVNHYFREGVQLAVDVVEGMPEPKEAENGSMPCPDARNSHDRTTDDCISRQTAIDAIFGRSHEIIKMRIGNLPSAQPTKEIPKRVLWSGWKGCRDTRYKCPNCKKPVRNDDAYCHKCGQRLMFPKISFTDYVPGEKQDVIVRWDDEE